MSDHRSLAGNIQCSHLTQFEDDEPMGLIVIQEELIGLVPPRMKERPITLKVRDFLICCSYPIRLPIVKTSSALINNIWKKWTFFMRNLLMYWLQLQHPPSLLPVEELHARITFLWYIWESRVATLVISLAWSLPEQSIVGKHVWGLTACLVAWWI